MQATAVTVLRQQLAAVVAGTPSPSPGLPTGVRALDTILPGGGIPAGRITELLAPPGLGKTTLARSLVVATLRRGGAVAWVDATRTLDPRDWAAPDEGIWMVRPPDPARGPWCADLLLRSAAFALVVLDGAPVLPRVVAVRLAQLARESDAALLLLGDGPRASEVGGALRLRLTANASGPSPGRAQAIPRTTVTATLEKGGPYSHVQLELGHDLGERIARRLCANPQVPDRRGVARTRKPAAVSHPAVGSGSAPRPASPPASPSASRIGTRSRRFAQPDYPPR